MKVFGVGSTDRGQIRVRNEDCLLVDNELGLYVVSDGMGGCASGHIASRLAVYAVADYVHTQRKLFAAIREGSATESWLTMIATEAVAEACSTVFETASVLPGLHGMGCTLTVLLVGREHAAMAHVGDSRLYQIRGGVVEQLSEDHTVLQEGVRRGYLTQEQAAEMGADHVLTRSIGRRAHVEIDEMIIDLEAGDRFVLCSDGLSSYVDDQALHEFLQADAVDGVPGEMIAYANHAGGSDNITALVVQVADDRHEHIARDEYRLSA